MRWIVSGAARSAARFNGILRPGLVLLAVSAMSAGSAQAAFPGHDGRIAFDQQVTESGLRGLFSVTSTGRGLRRIGGIQAGAPAWSADGRRLAFSSQMLPPFGALFVSRSDGQSARQIAAPCVSTSLNTCGGILDSPSWAPDGRRLAFVNLIGNRSCPPSDLSGCGPDLPVGSALEVVDGDGTHRLTLLHSNSDLGGPAWSPDGRSIVYAVPGSGSGGCTGSGLASIRPDGTRRQLLVGTCRPGLHRATSPDWSPDGSRVAFSAVTRTIYWNCPLRPAVPPFPIPFPAVPQDCRRVPAPRHGGSSVLRDDVVDIYVVDRQGRHLRRVTRSRPRSARCVLDPASCSASGHEARTPCWSPSGRSIAYAGGGIWTVSPAGGHPRRVVSGADAADPAWQPVP
jgi:Tol biopolymer transport system component